jgi:hypothetical protein
MKWLIWSPLPRTIMSIQRINCELIWGQLNLSYFCSLIPWLTDSTITPLGHSQIRPSTRVYQLPQSPTDSLICSATPPYTLPLDNSLNHSHARLMDQSGLFHRVKSSSSLSCDRSKLSSLKSAILSFLLQLAVSSCFLQIIQQLLKSPSSPSCPSNFSFNVF